MFLIVLSQLTSCKEKENVEIISNWLELPKPVKHEFSGMIKDTSNVFIRCKSLGNNNCNFQSVWYKKNGTLRFNSGNNTFITDVSQTSLRLFVIFGDTLYVPIKESSFLKEIGSSLENTIHIDTLAFKKIVAN